MVTGSAAHDLEQLDEVGALHRQKLGERRAARSFVVGQDHLAHGADAVLVEEHVLGAAQPDALGAEFDRGARVGRRIGIGAHFQFAHGRRPISSPWRIRRPAPARSIATLPASTWPVEPSMVSVSPFFSVMPPAVMVWAR